MLCHGIAIAGLLLSKFVLIWEYIQGNKCDSTNSKAIDISSLLSKVFNIIILDSQNENLNKDISYIQDT